MLVMRKILEGSIMKNIIIGNGVNIQFAGNEYFNSEILSRAVNKLNSGKFNEAFYTKEVGQYLQNLVVYSTEILNNKKDHLIATTYEKKILPEFKKRNYSAIINQNYKRIGLEDYFFIHHILCRDRGVGNPDLFYITKSLERLFLDSIYNDGMINEIQVGSFKSG